jgi:hypothetical protein
MQYVTPIDRQRARVYRWEAAVVYRDPNVFSVGLERTLDELQAWADGATNYLGVRPVQAIVQVARPNPIVRLFHRRILLPNWARQTACVAHEVAHLAEWTTKHPPAWVRCYIDLLAREGLSETRLLLTAKQFGVKVSG